MGKLLSTINKTSFWICLTFAIIFGIAGFLVPPMGVIDGSVLMFIGVLFLFATLGTVIVSIEKGSDVTVKKGDFEVTVNNDDNEQD